MPSECLKRGIYFSSSLAFGTNLCYVFRMKFCGNLLVVYNLNSSISSTCQHSPQESIIFWTNRIRPLCIVFLRKLVRELQFPILSTRFHCHLNFKEYLKILSISLFTCLITVSFIQKIFTFHENLCYHVLKLTRLNSTVK